VVGCLRCAPVTMLAGPKTTLTPMAVVEAQLAALQQGEVKKCFDFSSTSFRRVAGPRQRFERIVREAPEYRPLVDCERFEVLSALQVGPKRWKCRVRVENNVGRMPFSVDYRWELRQQASDPVAFDLGQVLLHKKYGYRGVIVGWDHECKQKEEWCARMKIDALQHGRAQPFYHVLVDERDREGAQLTYVAQECVQPIEATPIQHPAFRKSFTGALDAERGAYKPVQPLREQYPLGLEGCWLVDQVFPDSLATNFDA